MSKYDYTKCPSEGTITELLLPPDDQREEREEREEREQNEAAQPRKNLIYLKEIYDNYKKQPKVKNIANHDYRTSDHHDSSH